MNQNLLQLSDVGFSYDNKTVIKDVSLEIASGEIVSILGSSGCGKSTLLRLIAGLERPSSGDIHGNNIVLRFLFQNYDAFPWFTVWENVHAGSGPPPYPSYSDVKAVLTEVGLWEDKDRYPAELSGGMRKRLGLARCLVRKPSIVLLDEPFSSLDIDTRWEMYELLQQLWSETACTIIIVTHDIHEAILLSDRIVVMPKTPAADLISIEVTLAHPRSEAISDCTEYIHLRHRIIDHLTAGNGSRYRGQQRLA